MLKMMKQYIICYFKFERALLKLKCLKIKNELNLRRLIESYYSIYQESFRYYEDEYEGMKEKRIDYLLRKENRVSKKIYETSPAMRALPLIKLKKEMYTYFYNRWLRRN